ncbi:MAG: hypothetical protein IPK82_33080 [Polyangiaceae bacterium]|nr:hypothetical protein [Polyangiaceae bacterium]
MDIVADALIPFARPVVFATYRDHLPDLVRYLPNIRDIRVVSRVDRENEVELVNEWKGGGDIPAVARSVLSESMLTWTDYATWFLGEYRVAWRTDVHAFRGAVKSSGQNRYVEVPQGTRLEIRGTFTCDASKVKGVPSLLAKTVGQTIEKMLVTQIAKNAVEIARGVEQMLNEKHSQ